MDVENHYFLREHFRETKCGRLVLSRLGSSDPVKWSLSQLGKIGIDHVK